MFNAQIRLALASIARILEEAKTPKAQDPLSVLQRHVKTALSWLQAGAPEGASESLTKALKTEIPVEMPNKDKVVALLKSAQKKVGSVSPRAADEDVEKALRLLGVKK